MERETLCAIAARLLRDEPGLGSTAPFGQSVTSGLGTFPKLLIGDHSEIALLPSPEESQLGYRIALLAGDGDMLLIGRNRSPDYETYLAGILGIETLDTIHLRGPTKGGNIPLASRCLQRPDVVARIVEKARSHGGLSVVPSIATGSTWLLAREIAASSGVEVAVCGPPPRLTQRANDKLWFADLARDVLGQTSIPPTFAAYGPAALAGHVVRLARNWDKVVVKVPDSAGSAGNLPIDPTLLENASLTDVRDALIGLLGSFGWTGRFPLMVEVWDCNVLASPSVQLWIPDRQHGPPVVEGLFEQFVTGEEGVFVGAARADLPDVWIDRLALDGLRLALVLQSVGYFGRCSFDSVLAGTDFGSAELHWIECNARWGGVSLPMTLANRLLADAPACGLAIIQHRDLRLRPRSFLSALDSISNLMFRPGASREGVVLLTPTGLEQGTGIHLMATADDTGRARRLAGDAAMRLSQS